jgi:hypothetical protein
MSGPGGTVSGVSEPGSPPAEEAFGAPPGDGQWPQPGPAATPVQHGYPSPQPYPAPAYPPASQPGQPGRGYASPGGYPAYAPTSTVAFPVSAVVLLVVSVISLVATGIIGIPSAVVAVIAWRRHAHDPGSARRLTTRGWIAYAVNFAVGVPLLIWFYVWALGHQ